MLLLLDCFYIGTCTVKEVNRRRYLLLFFFYLRKDVERNFSEEFFAVGSVYCIGKARAKRIL